MSGDVSFENRLISEKSPYLLQHAHNPVDWYPWGDEAFSKAKSENKPVFLSIGYSTCHWCHVMAHESFEDAEVAAALNRDFISVKVDREERPDIDAVYMKVCQALTGSGGWPLTVFLAPDGKPFWAGTYLPKSARYGQPGLTELLNIVAYQWKNGRQKLLQTGEAIVSALNRPDGENRKEAGPDKKMLRDAFGWYCRNFDAQWGGFGTAPKFPAAHNLLFLLRYSVLEQNQKAREMAEHTLVQMYRGGIFDHIGGGFSRYSTDERWLVPHFEKMLYDNALLAQAYGEAFRLTRRPLYSYAARRTFDYVLRELGDGSEGFACGQDADSDGVEGKFYGFTPEELRNALGEAEGKAFCQWFGISAEGNFEGKSIPNLLANPMFEEENPQMGVFCEKLRDFRRKRAGLHRDDKVLTAWNALMIAALADGSGILREPAYLAAAKNARNFLTGHVAGENGRLFARWRDGEAAHAGHLDDYAFCAFAFLKLYEASFDAEDLECAAAVAGRMRDLFFDAQNGGFYLTASDAEALISRPKELYDGAMPSGNSIAAQVLTGLFKLTGQPEWQRTADKHLAYLAAEAEEHPAAHSAALAAFADVLYPSQELVCTTSEESAPAELSALLSEMPARVFTVVKTRANQERLARIAPYTAAYPIPQSGAAYYPCRNGICGAPMQGLDALQKWLRRESYGQA